MNCLLSREISQTSAALVESTTKALVDRRTVEQSSVRQRSMSNPQPPTSQLDNLSTVNKSALKVAATPAPPEIILTKQSDSLKESRPRAQSTVVPTTVAHTKMVRRLSPTKMPTAPPPKPPSASEASSPGVEADRVAQSPERTTASSPKPAANWARARSSSVLEATKESTAAENVTSTPSSPTPPRR